MTPELGNIESILRSMNEGVVAVNAEQRVLVMNHAAANHLGLLEPLSPGDMLWSSVLFPELEKAVLGVLDTDPLEKESSDGESGFSGDAPSPLGSGRILNVSVSPLRPTRGAVVILTDVTRYRRLEQVRIDFVANVSHEMRTPLAAVLGAIETMEDPNATMDDMRRFLGLARRNAERMRNIVTDLLELSHIEADEHQTQLVEVNLELPVRASASALSGEAEAKGVALVVESSPESPLNICGSDKRLEQIFTNLIGNAIKYTPRGGQITVRMLPRENEIAVEVKDTGMGIPQDAIPRVFERFYRVDKARSREMGGTGLGLAIVKHATRVHHGRIEVESEEDEGSTFRVVLPRWRRMLSRSEGPALRTPDS